MDIAIYNPPVYDIDTAH